jgi:two-component system, OmpR family, sensor histidine kinase VicK
VAKKKHHKQAYVRLTLVTSLFHLMVGLFIVAIFLLEIEIANKNLMAVILGSIATAGIVYNLILARPLIRRREFFAKYLEFLFVIAEAAVVVYFTGGGSSPWYPVFLIIIVGGSVLGFTAFFINAGLVAVLYVGDILASLASSSEQLKATSFPATIAAFVFAGFIAYTTDKYIHNDTPKPSVTSDLESTNMTERLMLGSIADPVVGINNEHKIILMNEPAQSLTGWDMHDALNLDYNQVFKLKDMQDQDATGANDPFVAVLESHKPIRSDKFYILSKGNAKISLFISIGPTFDSEGKPSGAIAIIRDISEQKALAREKNEFVSTASHEMRTPVAAIEGYISMAQNPNLSQIDDKARGFLEKAHESALHLGKLFQDLLSVSKIEDRNISDTKKVFNISDLVLKIAAEMQINAQKKGVQLFTHIGGADIKKEKVIAPTNLVNANPDRITEVLTNLLDNAIKYTEEGNIDIEIDSDQSFVTIKVHDTGMGISEQDQKHLFEKFYRVDNELTRTKPGTGLGLYISRNLLEMYGGSIWVESKPGKGSTFAFKLPIAKM